MSSGPNDVYSFKSNNSSNCLVHICCVRGILPVTDTEYAQKDREVRGRGLLKGLRMIYFV